MKKTAYALLFFIFILLQGSEAAIYFARTSGNWNNPATWSNAGYGASAAISTPGSAPGDVVLLSGCQVTVTSSPAYAIAVLSISQNYNSGNDTRLLLNDAGKTLTCNSISLLDNGRNNNTEIVMSAAALLQVNGSVSVTRSTSNNRDKRLGIYISGGGRMNVTGNFNFTYGRAISNETQQDEITLDNGRLDVGGNMNITVGNSSGNNNRFEFAMANNAICNVAGNLTAILSNSNDDDELRFDLYGGTFTVNGTCSTTVATTATSDNAVIYTIDDASFYTGSFTYSDFAGFYWGRAQVSVQGSGLFQVNGDFSFLHGYSSWNSTTLEISINDAAQCIVTGSAFFTLSNTNDGDDMIVDLNGGWFTVADAVKVSVDPSSTGGCSFTMAIDGGTIHAGDFIINHNGGSGGDINIYMNRSSVSQASQMIIDGNWTFTHTAGDNLNFQTYANSYVTIGGTMEVNIATSSDGDLAYLDFNGGTINIGTVNCIISSGATSANHFYFTIDGASVSVNGDFNVSQYGGGGSGDINLWLNKTSAASQATLYIGGNVSLNHTGGDNMEIEINSGATMLIAGDLTDSLTSNDGDDMMIDINGGTLTVQQDFNHIQTGAGSSFEDLDLRIDNNGEFNINGSANIYQGCGGQIIIYLNASSGTSAVMNIGNDLYIEHSGPAAGVYLEFDQQARFMAGGNMIIDNYASGGDNARIRVNNSAAVNISGNLVMNLLSGSTVVNDNIELDINGGSVSIEGDLEMNAGSGRDAILTVDGAATLNVSGSVKLNHSGGNLMYLYAGNAGTSPSVNAGAVELNDTGGGQTRLRLWNSSQLTVTGNITFSAIAASQVDIALYNTSRLRLAGDFNRAISPNRFGILSCATGAAVELNGSSMQLIAGTAGDGGDGFTYSNIILNNTSAVAPQFQMTAEEGNVVIPAGCTLTFTKGIVSALSSAFFIISNGASVSSASDLSYVDGPVRKVGTQAFVFPIGAGNNYRPAAISAPSNATHHFTARYFASDPGGIYNDQSKDASLNHISDCEYWYINRTNGNSNVVVTLSWDETSCGVDDLSSLRIAQWDGGVWRNRGNGAVTGNTASGSVSASSAITSFLNPDAPFTLASSNSNNPLPVEWLDFSAKVNDDAVELDWHTASEKQNDYFLVQRSADGQHFEDLANIEAKGQSVTITSYSFTDLHPLNGVMYYRIKQVDINNDFTFSPVRSVLFNQLNQEIRIFPNPSSGDYINLELNNDMPFLVDIYNMSGEKILSENFSGGSGLLNFSHRLGAGTYAVIVTGEKTYRSLLIIE